jgi:hypothetical protein
MCIRCCQNVSPQGSIGEILMHAHLALPHRERLMLDVDKRRQRKNEEVAEYKL